MFAECSSGGLFKDGMLRGSIGISPRRVCALFCVFAVTACKAALISASFIFLSFVRPCRERRPSVRGESWMELVKSEMTINGRRMVVVGFIVPTEFARWKPGQCECESNQAQVRRLLNKNLKAI